MVSEEYMVYQKQFHQVTATVSDLDLEIYNFNLYIWICNENI